jgi:hypothetical protein
MRSTPVDRKQYVPSYGLQLDYKDKPIAVRTVGFSVKFLDECQKDNDYLCLVSHLFPEKANNGQLTTKKPSLSKFKKSQIRKSETYQGMYEVDVDFCTNYKYIRSNQQETASQKMTFYLVKVEDRYLIVGMESSLINGQVVAMKHWQSQFHAFNSEDTFSACVLKDERALFSRDNPSFCFAIETDDKNVKYYSDTDANIYEYTESGDCAPMLLLQEYIKTVKKLSLRDIAMSFVKANIDKKQFDDWVAEKFKEGNGAIEHGRRKFYNNYKQYLQSGTGSGVGDSSHNEIVLSYNNNKNPIKLILPKRTNDNEEQEDIQRGKALAEFLSHNGNDVTLVKYDDNNFEKNKKHKFYPVLESGKEITIKGKEANPFIYKEETPQPPTSIIKPETQFPFTSKTPQPINGTNYTLYKDPADTENNTAFRTRQEVEIATNDCLNKLYDEAFAFSLKETNKKLQKLKLGDITVKDALSIYQLKIENPEKLTKEELQEKFKNFINKDSMLEAYKSLGHHYQQFMEGEKIYTGREENLRTDKLVGKRIKRMGIDFFDKLKERLTAEVNSDKINQ